jgi:hypothetical protein
LAWWYLLLLATAGVAGYAIWNFRRKAGERQAARASRLEKMLGEHAPASATAQPPSAAPAGPTAAVNAPSAPSAAAPVASARFLGQAESLLYYLLKAGLPEFEIFAGVSLARVIGAAGSDRDRELQLRRLSQYQLDFVICDKSMKVLSVVELDSAAGAEAAGDRRFKSDLLKQAGIRLVRVNPAALPRREQVRALVHGATPESNG